MSRFEKLEQTFDLPKLEDTQLPDATTSVKSARDLQTSWREQDHFELHDEEMDQIADVAFEYSQTLHELGMGCEVKHAGEIFNASANMLKIATDARNLKMEKKLKLMKLELDRLKLDRSMPESQEAERMDQPGGTMDRNDLLEQIRSISGQMAK